MKRRDLEVLKNRQTEEQRQKRRRWIRNGFISFGIVTLLVAFFFGRRLFNIALHSSDCTRMSQAFSTLNNYLELSGEFDGKAQVKALSKQPIEAVDKARFTQIADIIDSEYERMKDIPIKDEFLKQYYSQFVDGIKFNATRIRNFTASPSLETYKGTDQNRVVDTSVIYRIQARCSGFSNEEFEQAARQETDEYLKKLREDAKNKPDR
jgi:hypothetical protein